MPRSNKGILFYAALVLCAMAVTGPAAADPRIDGILVEAGWPSLADLEERTGQALARGDYLEACMWSQLGAVRSRRGLERLINIRDILEQEDKALCRSMARVWRPGAKENKEK